MDSILDIKRKPDENEEQYTWRLGQAKDSGILDMEWDKIADLINNEFREDDVEYKEAAYRKPYAGAKRYYEAGVFNQLNEDQYFKELQLQKQELRKEKQKLSDERVELNRRIREEARKESYLDLVKRIICENTAPQEIDLDYFMPASSPNDLLCHLTDIHTGIEISNWKNTFDENVLKERIAKFASKIIDVRSNHNSENCYIVIGEIISGLIHNNLRLQNNMDLMEQFKYISELISSMLVRICPHFNHIYIYTTPGNHSRISPKKEESLDGENMDILLPFYLKAKLQNIKNITICENSIEPEIAMFNIRGKNIFASHGHKDTPANVVQNFTMLFGIKPDIVLLGHRHLNGLTTVFDAKVIESGCLSGTDQYAISIRKANRPEQTISIVDEKGLVCLYDIQLD